MRNFSKRDEERFVMSKVWIYFFFASLPRMTFDKERMKIEWKIIFFVIIFFLFFFGTFSLLVCFSCDFNFWLMMLNEWSIDFMGTVLNVSGEMMESHDFMNACECLGEKKTERNSYFAHLNLIKWFGFLHWQCYFLRFEVIK